MHSSTPKRSIFGSGSEGREINLVVQADGRGFDLQAVQASPDERGSFSLLSLNECTALVGGKTELLSAPG